MSDKKALKWLLKTTKAKKGYIILLVFLRVILSAGGVCFALAMKMAVDGAVKQNKNEFLTGILFFGSLMLFTMIVSMIIRRTEEATKSEIENTLKEKLFNTLMCKDYEQVSAVHSEQWMNRLTSDTTVCSTGITDIVPNLAGMLVRLVGALVMLFALTPVLVYILVPCAIVFIPLTLVIRKYLKKHHKAVQEKDGEMRVYLQERISNMLVLHTFGKEEQSLVEARGEFLKHKKARMKKNLVSNFCNAGFSLAINGMYLIGFSVCGFGILNGDVTYGTLTAVVQLVGQLQGPLSGISGVVPKYYSMLASAERLYEAEEFNDIEKNEYITDQEINELYNYTKSIVFKEVSYSYKNSTQPVLDNVSITVNKGDFIALTGQSGCGKSTLLKLLMGIYNPTSGSVSLITDSEKSISTNKAKKLFSYVPQGNCLMSGKIRDVITFNSDLPDEKRLSKAVRLACADFIYELPDSFDTTLGEKGMGLSEGQMQRISIARALYTNSPVLILDEATSALDIDTERQLLDNLKQLTDKTVFVVTHRPEALKICNKNFDFTHKI